MDEGLQEREEKLKKFGFEIRPFRSVWKITSIDDTDIPKAAGFASKEEALRSEQADVLLRAASLLQRNIWLGDWRL